MKRVFLAAAAACAALVVAAPSGAHRAAASCSSGYVDAIVGGVPKCLHAGEFCSPAHEADYERYGFQCVAGRLRSGGATPSASGGTYPDLPVLLRPVTRTSGCKLGPLPDRRCSPGAYSRSLTKAVICSATFRTSSVRNVSTATRRQVEEEYGLAPKPYGHALEIDHIVSLEHGGSNSVANLFPERAPGFHVKDKLENAAHDAVCNGTITLAYAQHQIAANWELLYKRLFGVMPAA